MRTAQAITFGIAASVLLAIGAHAQGTHRGTIVQVEEARGTITVSETSTGTMGSSAGSATQEYKLQDGLLFNALKVGDPISFTVEERNGVRTIPKLADK